jgi:hypothetical protein
MVICVEGSTGFFLRPASEFFLFQDIGLKSVFGSRRVRWRQSLLRRRAARLGIEVSLN